MSVRICFPIVYKQPINAYSLTQLNQHYLDWSWLKCFAFQSIQLNISCSAYAISCFRKCINSFETSWSSLPEQLHRVLKSNIGNKSCQSDGKGQYEYNKRECFPRRLQYVRMSRRQLSPHAAMISDTRLHACSVCVRVYCVALSQAYPCSRHCLLFPVSHNPCNRTAELLL